MFLEDNRYMSTNLKTQNEYYKEQEDTERSGKVVSFSAPKLSAKDKLYIRAYISTLSHNKAYEVLVPGLATYKQCGDNCYSRKEAVQFHIAQSLQDKADSFNLSPEVILEKLYKEATREGAGSNHAARIQALTQLGKHFGLFQEKKESNAHTFNIINYGTIESVEQLEPIQLQEPIENNEIPENVQLTTY